MNENNNFNNNDLPVEGSLYEKNQQETQQELRADYSVESKVYEEPQYMNYQQQSTDSFYEDVRNPNYEGGYGNYNPNYETKQEANYNANTSQSNENNNNTKHSIFKKPAFIVAMIVVFGVSVGIGSQLTGIIDGATSLFTGKNSASINMTNNVDGQNLAPKLVSQKETDLVSIVDKTSPNIVAITNKVLETDFFNNQVEQSGAGSGVICSENNDYLYIATNNHVIENSSEISVQFSTGSKVKAKIIGTDPSTDLAVIRVAKSDLDKNTKQSAKPIALGTSASLKVGQDAIAIGNALGIGISVSPGVVSAVDRELSESGTQKMIQTNAAINPGNSGGALLNSSGELIGITSVKISSTAVEGVGFAIPIDTALPIINDLINKGKVDRPYLGIYGRAVEEYEAQMYKVPKGVLIKNTVEGSGAEKAKIMSGDILIELDGKKVSDMNSISSILTNKKIGDSIKAKVYRDGKTIEITIILSERSA